MSTQRYISTSFWDDKWITTLSPPEKLFYLYLLTNPLTNIAGVYKFALRRAAYDIGYDIGTLSGYMTRYQQDRKAYLYGEYIVLPSWPEHQRWKSKPTIKIGIESILKELPEDVLRYLIEVEYRYPITWYQYQPSYSDSDSDINSDSDSDSQDQPEPCEKLVDNLKPNPLGTILKKLSSRTIHK